MLRPSVGLGLLMLLLLAMTSYRDVSADVPVIFYPFGTGQGDNVAPTNDDGYTSAVPISVGFPFFGSSQRSVYVNTNGDLSFSSGFGTYTPEQFPLFGVPMIAPYWADVDTLLNTGRVYYRQSTDPVLLARASLDITATFSTSGFKSFSATWIFIATWANVTYFGGSTATPTNTFQCVLITDGVHSFAQFNYATLTWTTGTASGGNSLTGLGGTPAQVGFNVGDATNYYAVPTSRTADIVNIYQQSNVGIKGRWIFRVDQAQIAPAGCQYIPACPLDTNTGLCAGSGLCSYQGDPHYTTCDGHRFDYMGICKYLLVGLQTGVSTTLPSFNVYGRNEYRNNVYQVSWFSDVEIAYGNDTVVLTRSATSTGSAIVTVNGVFVSLPYCMAKYTIYYSGKYVRYQADFGLAVETDGYLVVNIYIPPSFHGIVTGLCGNCDGQASNDMVVNGVNYQGQPTQFGDHFIVPDNSPTRPTTCPSLPATPLCSPLPASYVSRCQQLTDLTGPFGPCMRALDAAVAGTSTAIYNSCLLDACYGNSSIICQHVWNLVDMCAFQGFQIPCNTYQTFTQCPVVCPAGMVFECNSNRLCMPTCDNPVVSTSCTRPQKDGCVCPMGQLLYNGTCTASCPLGCVDVQNNIHPVGDIWGRSGCTELTCVACANCPYGHQIQNISVCSSSQICSNGNCVTAPSTTPTTTPTTTTPTTTPSTTPNSQRPNSYIIYSANGGVLTYVPSSSNLNGLALVTTDNILLATTFVFMTPCLASQVPSANLSSGQCISLQADDGSTLIAVNIMGGVSMMSTASIQTQFSCLFNADASVFIRGIPAMSNFYQLQSVGFTSFYFSSMGVTQPVVMYYNNGQQPLPSTTSYFFQLTYTGFSTVSSTCPNVWTLANMARPMVLGTLQGNYSISYCRQLCLVYPNCIGVSVQNNLCVEGSFPCYFTVLGAANQSLVIDPTFTHYDLTPTYPAQCTGACMITWTQQMVTVTNLTTPSWYTSTANQTTARSCRSQCQSDPTCVGLKWTSVGGVCSLYYHGSTAANTMVPFGSNLAIQVPQVNTLCDRCSNAINVLMNVSDPAATAQTGVTGYQTCLTLCMNNVKCSGFQLQAGGACYLSFGVQLTSTVMSSYSYFDVVRSPCGNGCQNQWKLYTNTASMNSAPYAGSLSIQSEQDCRSACMSAAVANSTACVGVDYNWSTNSCRFNSGAMNTVMLNTDPSASAGWTHYQLTLSPSCYSD